MALLVVTLTWALIRVAPGNFYASEKKLPPAIEENIKKKYGLDKPWYQQYGLMMLHIVQLDFGDSLKYQGQTVNEIIGRHLPYSATIGLLAYLLALIIGLAAGIIAAAEAKFSIWDYGSMALAMFGLSVPNFVFGPHPGPVFFHSDFIFSRRRVGAVSRPSCCPLLLLSAVYAAYIARLTRAGMLEVLRSDYIRTAGQRARRKDVLLKHALRGGIIPGRFIHGTCLSRTIGGDRCGGACFLRFPDWATYLFSRS